MDTEINTALELNKIIRRHGIALANSYNVVKDDFCTVFDGFSGVSIETVVPETDSSETDTSETDTSEYTVIYLDTAKKQKLKIIPDSTKGTRITFSCGDGTVENIDFLYADGTETRAAYISYSIVRTAYGIAFSIIPTNSDLNFSVSDGYLQNFFTTFEDDSGNAINGYVFVSSSKDATSTTGRIYISSEVHDKLECLEVAKTLLGASANHTVLYNAASYSNRIIAKHLFKKAQTEDSKFGKVKLNGRTFISGSHYCLEYEEE